MNYTIHVSGKDFKISINIIIIIPLKYVSFDFAKNEKLEIPKHFVPIINIRIYVV